MKKHNDWIWALLVFLLVALWLFGLFLLLKTGVQMTVTDDFSSKLIHEGLSEEALIPAGGVIVGPAQVQGFARPVGVQGPGFCLFVAPGVHFQSEEPLKARYFTQGDECCIFNWLWLRPCAVFYLLRLSDKGLTVYYNREAFFINEYKKEGEVFHLKKGEIFDIFQLLPVYHPYQY